MGLQKRLVRTRNRGRIGERARMVIDGPASEHELVLKGRLSTQAPEIDASVYLTECDPSRFASGDFAEVEIVAPGIRSRRAARAAHIVRDSEPGCRTQWASAHSFSFKACRIAERWSRCCLSEPRIPGRAG